MPATRFGINMGEILRDIESVKSTRTANRLAALQLGEAERIEARRPEQERQQQEQQNLLTGLRTRAVAGDKEAMQQLLVEGESAFIEAVGKMSDRQKEMARQNVDQIGKMSVYVLRGKSPEEQERRYSLMRDNLESATRARLPENYDPGFMEMSLSKATSMDQILEAPTVRTIGGEDVAYRGGREIERKTVPVKAGAGAGAGTGLKSADESLMYRQAGELLGGIRDQDGKFTNLDPGTRNLVQSITTEAANIFAREGNITRSEAVKRAAKAFGVRVREVPPANPEDPQTIKDYLLKR